MSPRARKRFGQHFLERAWVPKVLEAIDPHTDQAFLEIGPGRGALTLPLAARAAHVVAYEIDRDLAARLRGIVPPNVTIVEGDFLDLSREGLAPDSLGVSRVAANLPYNVASPILLRLIVLYAGGLPLADATLMLQREVADRLVARPGSRAYGLLTVLVGHRASVTRILNLPPGAFRPAPKVQSSLVRVEFHAPEPPIANPRIFEEVLQAAFSRRRKTLANALKVVGGDVAAAREVIDHAGLVGSRRPETLSIAEFARLSDALAASRGSCAIVRP